MNIFELFGTIAINNRDANSALKDTTDKAERAGAQIQKAFKSIGSATVKAGKVIVTGATAVATAWAGAVEGSRDYREAMGKLDAAFVANGHSSDTALKTYKALQAVLGETDQAVEAANHLAVLCDNEEDLLKWTDICTGVFATFGDSLPIEGLTEAINHTAQLGEVQGPLADALEWVGWNTEDFNKQLAACLTTEERQKLIMDTLYNSYRAAGDQYKKTAGDVMEANTAQDKLNASIAKIGAIGEPIMTGLKSWVADMVTAAVPHIETLVAKLINFDTTMENEVWPWLQKQANVMFGIELPDWETFKGDVEVWWAGTKVSIEEWCRFALAFAGFLPWNEDNQKALIDWWDGVYAKIGEICTWKIPSPTELTEEDANKVVESIQKWWDGVVSRLRLVIGITPQVQEKYSNYQDDVDAAAGGSAVSELIVDNFTTNSDNPGIQAALDFLFGRTKGTTQVTPELEDGAEDKVQGELDGMDLSSEVKLYPDMTAVYSTVGSMSAGTSYGGGGVNVPLSHASGLDRVPRDGYLARVHKDEAILDEADADIWRGTGTSKIEALLAQLVANTMGGQMVVLDTGAMVGQLAPMMDAKLGTISHRRGRGN